MAPTRLFHWLVVALVAAAYATSKLNWMDWHARAGEALLALVLFRLLWGFFGSETARFSSFLAPPRVAAAASAHVFRREPDHQVGHNPAGGWMVLLLLALLLGETLSGLYVANDVADEGPLTEWVPARSPTRSPRCTRSSGTRCWRQWRCTCWRSSSTRRRRGTIWSLPMITGRKTLPAQRAPRA